MTRIYHLTTRNASLLARNSGVYRADSLARDGFIHFSQLHQLLGVANAFYVGQTDLVVLVVDPSRLQAELKYEAPVHPSASVEPAQNEDSLLDKRLNNNADFLRADLSTDLLFPHLYGPLNFDAVLSLVDFPPGPAGQFVLPAALSGTE